MSVVWTWLLHVSLLILQFIRNFFTTSRLCCSGVWQWSSGSVSDCRVRNPTIQPHRGQCRAYHDSHCDIDGLHTISSVHTGRVYGPWAWVVCIPAFTAVPRSTQYFILRSTVKRVLTFGLNYNNKWRWLMWTAQVGWLGVMVGGHLALSLHSPNEPRWTRCHDNSSINIYSVIMSPHRITS